MLLVPDAGGAMTLADALVWLRGAPAGTLVPAHAMLAMLETPDASSRAVTVATRTVSAPVSWRERIWTVPKETRLGVREVAEAVGRSVDWVYKHTGPGGTGLRLPHRKIDGQLVFVASEIRTWVAEAEEVIEPSHRGGLSAVRP